MKLIINHNFRVSPPQVIPEANPTIVKKSVNSIMLDLYAKSPKPTATSPPISSSPVVEINDDDSNETKSAKKKKIKSGKIEFIEDDAVQDTTEPVPPREKNIAELVADKVNTIELTEFEKIKLKAQKLQESLNNSSGKKAKKRPRTSGSQDSVKESEPQKSEQIVTKRVSVDLETNMSPVANIAANDDLLVVSVENTTTPKNVNGVLNGKNIESNSVNKNRKEPIEIMDIDDEVQTVGKNNLKRTPAKTPIRKSSSAGKRNQEMQEGDFSYTLKGGGGGCATFGFKKWHIRPLPLS